MTTDISSSSSTPSTKRKISDYLIDEVRDTIDAQRLILKKKTIYLGDVDSRNRLTWYKTDLGDFVIEKTKQQTDTASKSTNADITPSPARLSVIGFLTHRDFFLSSDGNWTERIAAAENLADVKISCTACAPDREGLSQEFNHCLDTIDGLISRASNAQFSRQTFRSKSLADNKQKIKFRHILFEVTSIHLSVMTYD